MPAAHVIMGDKSARLCLLASSLQSARSLRVEAMTDYIVEDIWEFQSPSPAPPLRMDGWPAKGGDSVDGFGTDLKLDRASLRLSDIRPSPLTLISAPAGYGKSRLLQQWARELTRAGHRPLKITADRDQTLMIDGASGERQSVPSHDHHALMALVRCWLDTRGRGIVLIDDAHLLPEATAQAICAFFLQMARRSHSLILATRGPLPVPLARARAQRLVRDIGTGALKLTSDELSDHAERAYGITLGANGAQEILSATAGWPAATDACLQRAGEIGLTGLLRELRRGSRLMDDFFAEEILQPLPVRLRDFLIDASALGTLTADACNAALGIHDGGDMIERAIRANLFITPVDGCRTDFRLLPLFADFLRAQLLRSGRTRHDAIALAAAAWFERHNRLPEAFDCAVHAEAWDKAAALLDVFGMRGCLTGQGALVTAMALRLPKDVLRQHPRAAVFAARGASTGWRFGLVEDFLRLADETTLPDGSAEVEGLVLHSRMLSAQYEDNQIAAGQKCLALLARIDTFDHYTRGTIYGSLLYARREQFDFTDGAHLESAAIREFNLSERPLGMVWHLSVVGPTYAMRGDQASAARRLDEASAIAAGLVEAEWIASVPALLRAEICYESNDLGTARKLIERHHPAPLVGFIDQYVAGFVVGAKLLWLAGDIAGAHRRIDEGLALAESRSLERLRQSMIGERIRLLLATGDPERALEIGRQEALLGSGARMHPRGDCTTRDAMRAMSWVRLAIARGELAGAVELGQVWKRFTAKAGAVRCAMRWEILLARAYAAQGQTPRAQRELRSALARAVAGNFIRSFLDEGEQVVRLLKEQLNASQIQTGTIDGFVALLLQESSADCRSKVSDTAAHPDLKAADGNRLTKIQTEILQMASAGLQNREIAQRVGMTEGSVKWYMQQIFNKIGIRKRAGSLERARSLGLI